MRQPRSSNRRKGATNARPAKGTIAVKSSRPEPRVLMTMRLRQSLRRDLEATAVRNRRSVADVAQELLDEALRTRQCPGIYFADEASGRTAKIGGTGLAVWEVMRDFSREQDAGIIRKAFPQLSQAQVTAALMYYSRYRDDVQARIDANAALTPEAIERQYPGLVRFTRCSSTSMRICLPPLPHSFGGTASTLPPPTRRATSSWTTTPSSSGRPATGGRS
jgi:uncharacterized protein (DUF433 family)